MKNDITLEGLSESLGAKNLRRVDLFSFDQERSDSALIQNAYLFNINFSRGDFSRVWPRDGSSTDDHTKYQTGFGLQGITQHLWRKGFPVDAMVVAALMEKEFGYKIDIYEPNSELEDLTSYNLLMLTETQDRKVSIVIDTDLSSDWKNYGLTVALVGLATEVVPDRNLSPGEIAFLLSDLASGVAGSSISAFQRRIRRELSLAILAPRSEAFRSFEQAHPAGSLGVPRSIIETASSINSGSLDSDEIILPSPTLSPSDGLDDYRASLMIRAGGGLSAATLAHLLKLDVGEVEQLSKKGKLFSVRWRDSDIFPKFEFDLIHEGRGNELESIIRSLYPRNTWSVLEFFLQPNAALGSTSPLEAVKAGRKDLVERLLVQYEADGYT